MKKYSFLFFFLTFFSFKKLFSQEGIFLPSGTCSNYNAYAKNGKLEEIKPHVISVLNDGTLYLDPSKKDDFNIILNLMDLPENTTFQVVKETDSRLFDRRFYREYQQFYNDVKVKGGGYVIGVYGEKNIGGGSNPCEEPVLLVPRIMTGINNVNTIPSISDNTLSGILEVNEISNSELLIGHNLSNECEYKLVWEVAYYNEGNKISWIDAHNGNILKTEQVDVLLNAPTPTYGVVALNDKKVGNETRLESPDDRLRVVEKNNCPYSNVNIEGPVIKVAPVPKTTNTEWTTEASPASYQSFYVGSIVLEAYDELGIHFNKLHLTNCEQDEGAQALFGSNQNEAFISIGNTNGGSNALFDVLAHELGHVYLFQFIDYVNTGTSVHEGLADIIGTYIENKIQQKNGQPSDFVMGDDNPAVRDGLGRDLTTPKFSCFDQVKGSKDFDNRHDRGTPLGNLFFLISTGSPALSADLTMKIIFESLTILESKDNVDYPELMKATLKTIIEKYGTCSNEFLAFARAWETICVPTGFATNGVVSPCNYNLNTSPNITICEEDNYLSLAIEETLTTPPNSIYNWFISGKGATDFEFDNQSSGGGNSQHGTWKNLRITKFPNYPYYPQYISIDVTSNNPNGNPPFLKVRVKIEDCNGDKPTCEEYFGIAKTYKPESIESISNEKVNDFTPKSENIKWIKVYDLQGRLLHEESFETFNDNKLQQEGLVIKVYFDDFGKIINKQKSFLVK